MKKRFLSIFIVVVMLFGILPSAVMAEDSITAYVTISKYGEFVTDKNGDVLAMAPVTLSGEESYTLDDVFTKTHELYYDGEDGYDSVESAYGLSLNTLWGDTSGMCGYQVNCGDDYVLDMTHEITDGDIVEAYIIKSVYPDSEAYTKFDKTSAQVQIGEEVELTLSEAGYDENWNTVFSACSGAVITVDGVQTEAVTDENGKAVLSFDEAGEYIVSAQKTKTVNDETVTAIVSPVCVITVAQEQTKWYDITVKTAPSDVNVEFYNCMGYDENGFDILGDKIEAVDGGVADDYHCYTMKLEKGIYSYRAKDADGNSLGGMSFEVTGEENEIVLRRVNVYTTTKLGEEYADADEYTAELIDADGHRATTGAVYTDTYTIYPYLVYAQGNAAMYTVKLIPSEEVEKEYNLGVNSIGNYAVSEGTTVLKKNGKLTEYINSVITAPKGSRVQVFNQIKNYYTEEVEAVSSADNQDGTVSHTFKLPKSKGTYTYRVSMEGKITKAGYINLKSEENAVVNVTFADNENPKVRPEYDTSTAIGKRLEDSILLNINPQNYLKMNSGDTFKVRPYRAWQIINGDTANVIIEPDFHYEIISGDCVTITQEGKNAVLTANKSGTAVIEVTYDAIEIGGNTNYTGIYGAIDPMRKGLFVVNVDGKVETEITMPKWDSDFDTVYFLGETGTYNFKPESSADITVICNNEEVTANTDGSYTLPINQGNNIVCVKAGSAEEYVVIKGNRLEVNIENATSPDEPIKQGDTVNISFDGLHMPMPKMGGVYNPGYGKSIKLAYDMKDGSAITSNGTQYDFINNHTISVTVYDEGSFKLNDGRIALTNMGGASGEHRNITDTGVGANFNASAIEYSFGVLPDIEFEVLKNEDMAYVRNVECDAEKITLTVGAAPAKSLQFYIASYDENGYMTKVKAEKKEVASGESTVVIDYTEFADMENITLYVWDENNSPVCVKTEIEFGE